MDWVFHHLHVNHLYCYVTLRLFVFAFENLRGKSFSYLITELITVIFNDFFCISEGGVVLIEVGGSGIFYMGRSGSGTQLLLAVVSGVLEHVV